MNQREIETIKKMYNEHVQVFKIAQEIGYSTECVHNEISLLIKMGELEMREDKRTVALKARRQSVLELTKQGLLQTEIAFKLKIPVSTVSSDRTKLRRAGYDLSVEKKEESKLPEGVVNCTPAISKTCKYGGFKSDYGQCNYWDITHKCRSVSTKDFVGCKHTECIYYEFDPDRKRRPPRP